MRTNLMPKQKREPGDDELAAIRSAGRPTARELFAQSHSLDHPRAAVRADATTIEPAPSLCRSSAGRVRAA
jgi:hypothetical protein